MVAPAAPVAAKLAICCAPVGAAGLIVFVCASLGIGPKSVVPGLVNRTAPTTVTLTGAEAGCAPTTTGTSPSVTTARTRLIMTVLLMSESDQGPRPCLADAAGDSY